MARRDHDQTDIGVALVFAALITAIGAAGVAPMAEMLESVLTAAHTGASATRACNICGVVEDTRVVRSAASRHGFSTVAGGGIEGVVLLLGTLRGDFRADPVDVYEVSVRMQDGSVRIIRDAVRPSWRPGDRVRIITGRIEPVSS